MATASVAFNPMMTLSGANSFQLQSQGYIQGAFMDDPVARMWVLPGSVATSVTTPIWGGMAIQENVPTLDPYTMGTIASPISIPAAANNVTGFTLFNRAHNMMITPGNPVPAAYAGMSVAYGRLGSNLRIPVKIDPTLVTTLENGSIAQNVSWDFTNCQLTAYVNGTNQILPVKILKVANNCKIINYNSSTSTLSWAYGLAALVQI